MGTIRFIAIGLLVLLGLFICYGIYYAIAVYFFFLKLLVFTAAITALIWVYFKFKK